MEFKHKVEILYQELRTISSENSGVLNAANQAIILCRNLLLEFKTCVSKASFENIAQEIIFFKELKQHPLANLVYYFEMKSFEIHFPKGSERLQRKYIKKKLAKLNKFFSDNLDFVQYIEQEKTYLDDRYFTREYFSEFNITHSKYYFRDPRFSSSHDLLLAKLTANKRLINYLNNRLKNIKDANCNLQALENLVWTASRTDMTELGYSLIKSGAVNQGKTSIREIINGLERLFNFDSGDPYKNFSEIRIRKKSRTKFLDELAVGLLSKMDTDDK